MDTPAIGKIGVAGILVALVVGVGGGYWYGREAGIAGEKARQEAARKAAEEKAAQAVNPFAQTTVNPFEKNPANPFDKVKVNPFE